MQSAIRLRDGNTTIILTSNITEVGLCLEEHLGEDTWVMTVKHFTGENSVFRYYDEGDADMDMKAIVQAIDSLQYG